MINGHCGCGSEVRYAFHNLACFDCGAGCCPACAIALESVTYCRICAGSLLGATTIRSGGPYDLH